MVKYSSKLINGKRLTQMQYDFTKNYVKNGFNAHQAALSAGYAKSVAHTHGTTLPHHPIIKKQIEKAYAKLEAKQINELCISMEEKARVLSRIIYDIVPKDETKAPIRSLYKEAIKAITELNRMMGDHAPSKHLSLNLDATREKLIEARRQYEEF